MEPLHKGDGEEGNQMALTYEKKLASTNEGASSSILRQVYTGNIRPVMEYGAATWATAAKHDTSWLAKVQIKGMHIISGGLNTTPTLAVETASKLPFLDMRQEGKVLTHSQMIKRLGAHPVSQHLQEPTKSRSKRTSFSHLVKHLATAHDETLPATPEERAFCWCW